MEKGEPRGLEPLINCIQNLDIKLSKMIPQALMSYGAGEQLDRLNPWTLL